MNTINEISDLKPLQTYYVYLPYSRRIRKVKLMYILNETVDFLSQITELYYEDSTNKINSSKHLVYINEIGIGLTQKEAISNYKKFNFQSINIAFNSYEKIRQIESL